MCKHLLHNLSGVADECSPTSSTSGDLAASWWYDFDMGTTHVLRVGDRGRVVLPVELREELGLQQGDYITVTVVDGKLTAQSPSEALGRVRRALRGTGVVEELLADRRREAALP